MTCIISHRVEKITGSVIVPGDKSISHRALIIAASAIGKSNIYGLLEGEDVLTTAKALKSLGAHIENTSKGTWAVHGRGVGGLSESSTILDMGNTGTGTRLLIGLLAAHPFNTTFTGDSSLNVRPMGRVISPLRRMGAVFKAHSGDRLPLMVTGSDLLKPVTESLAVASAQVKSAILLAGLNTRGDTTIIAPYPTRDHTENMLSLFGAKISIVQDAGQKFITLTGQPELVAQNISVPGDFSSAAFPLVAALLIPGDGVLLENICLNKFRTGLLATLKEMGAMIRIENEKILSGEYVGDIFVKFSPLKGVTVPSKRVPKMIDEFPILSIAAACADGKTIFEDVSELRFKESDRLEAIAKGLSACEVEVEQTEDKIIIFGKGTPPSGGAHILSNMDHRIAMAFLILGMVTEKPLVVDDASYIDTSFPNFVMAMNQLGGDLRIEMDL